MYRPWPPRPAAPPFCAKYPERQCPAAAWRLPHALYQGLASAERLAAANPRPDAATRPAPPFVPPSRRLRRTRPHRTASPAVTGPTRRCLAEFWRLRRAAQRGLASVAPAIAADRQSGGSVRRAPPAGPWLPPLTDPRTDLPGYRRSAVSASCETAQRLEVFPDLCGLGTSRIEFIELCSSSRERSATCCCSSPACRCRSAIRRRRASRVSSCCSCCASAAPCGWASVSMSCRSLSIFRPRRTEIVRALLRVARMVIQLARALCVPLQQFAGLSLQISDLALQGVTGGR